MTDLEKLSARVDELTAREEIRDVLYRYASLIDRLDAEGLRSVYHPEAIDIHWGTYIGNAHEFADYMTGELRDVRYVLHEITNPIIQLDGDRAFVESRYFSRVRIDVDSAPAGQSVELGASGRYLDIMEKRDGTWKIAHRRLARDGSSVTVITELGKRIPESEGKPSRDDLVYKGMAIRDHVPAAFKADVNIVKAIGEYARKVLWPA